MTHTQKYLKDGGRRVYTNDGYREARRKDREEAEGKELEKIRGATVHSITAKRTVWREEQKVYRKVLKQRKEEETQRWKEQCNTSAARGEKRPAKPPGMEKRAKTPVQFEEWMQSVRNFGDDELRELYDAADGEKDKEKKKQVLFDTMKVLRCDS
ncbi:hypothetical protein DAEQUDRAFT_770042 [Daedalea quercina L-15889]|uniref:Uncharacterized protein n=1 Tax=Daedalea quercina L-15889 TaxID=1314783 RepID=A0A165L7C6_9APHY|nr:hypothetical protein DAEQUDRAFT_770042 [Daedalea quercina L-15889]